MNAARFAVVYHLTGTAAAARASADEICYEQTVETPPDLLPRFFEPAQAAELAGQFVAFTQVGESTFAATISYPVDATALEIPQLLTVVFGNSSLKGNIRVARLELPDALLDGFRGPRFGAAGLRAALGVPHGPLLMGVLKPLGLSATQLAALAYEMALAGIELIKDDHGLTDQRYAPFAERVARCAAAVDRANRETGRRSSYIANVTAPIDQIGPRARLAASSGAGGVMLAPGLTGFDALRQLAEDDTLRLPLVLHPTLLGGWFTDPTGGIAPSVIFGQLARLAGTDATIFPNYGGRYAITRGECALVAAACAEPLGALRPMLAVPGGSVSAARVNDMTAVYGTDVAYLLGRGLFTPHAELRDNVAACRRLFSDLDGAAEPR